MTLSGNETFAALWQKSVSSFAVNTFLVFREQDELFPDSSWTYGEFDALVARTAGRLEELGVKKGDAVHICLKNCPGFLMVWLAVARVGAWMVPVDPDSSSRDIENQVARTTPKVGFCGISRAQTYRGGVGKRVPVIVELTETAEDAKDGSKLLGQPVDPVSVDPFDRLAIMFTSGTTAAPKGVALTQANYRYTGVTMSRLVEQKPDDRWYVCLPLFHGNAQYYCFLAAMAAGASVALSAAFTASGWPLHVHDMGATHASLFAAPIRMILARRRDEAPRLQLKHVWFAQSLTKAHFTEFAELCGVAPRQIYGMTETTAVVTADFERHPSHDTIGTVIPGRDVVLRDKVTHVPVPDGETGVITVAGVRGVDLFSGYLEDDVATAQAFPLSEGGWSWFSTGDLARRDPDGLLRFVGRIDDVIKVSGENVSLSEIEAALGDAPGVLEAAALAVDDTVRDKVPIAYVVPRSRAEPPTADQLDGWARKNLSPAARPREWRLINELPRTSVGKVRRFKLSETAQ